MNYYNLFHSPLVGNILVVVVLRLYKHCCLSNLRCQSLFFLSINSPKWNCWSRVFVFRILLDIARLISAEDCIKCFYLQKHFISVLLPPSPHTRCYKYSICIYPVGEKRNFLVFVWSAFPWLLYYMQVFSCNIFTSCLASCLASFAI